MKVASPNPGGNAVTVGRELRCTLADRSPPHVAGCIAPHRNLVTGAGGKSVPMRNETPAIGGTTDMRINKLVSAEEVKHLCWG